MHLKGNEILVTRYKLETGCVGLRCYKKKQHKNLLVWGQD